MQIEWWYWIVGGFVLIGLDLLIPSFTLIWFGVGALLAGLLGVLSPVPLAALLAFWLLTSISFTLLWRRYMKPKP